MSIVQTRKDLIAQLRDSQNDVERELRGRLQELLKDFKDCSLVLVADSATDEALTDALTQFTVYTEQEFIEENS